MMKIGKLLRKLCSLRSCFLILPPGALPPQGIKGAMKRDVSKHWCTLQWCASKGWVIAHENWTSCWYGWHIWHYCTKMKPNQPVRWLMSWLIKKQHWDIPCHFILWNIRNCHCNCIWWLGAWISIYFSFLWDFINHPFPCTHLWHATPCG